MPVPPITPLVIGNHGAWRYVRKSSAQGSCGVSGYPCFHPGVDLYGRAGTPVVSPEAGVVVIAADGSAPPFVGYGPWVILIRGQSGRYHLLSHLDPGGSHLAPIGKAVAEGELVGKTSDANHTHWEVRMRPTPGAGRTNLANNLDPIGWMKGVGSIVLIAVLGGGAYWIWRTYQARKRR
jgi:murein DD-endopeptidase MepM/ murein hydrolase activator NlpD